LLLIADIVRNIRGRSVSSLNIGQIDPLNVRVRNNNVVLAFDNSHNYLPFHSEVIQSVKLYQYLLCLIFQIREIELSRRMDSIPIS